MGSEMDTFAARLASFDIVLKPEKRRSSTTKGSKRIAWPHKSPSPADLAHAGFYYKPYETNPDNTTCFHCHRALDGWEEEDNPIDEHLKHAPDCAWAIMMDIQQHSSNPAEIEDPTSERVSQARLATFGSAWPHDGKRGWVCQSDKMVQGGWFFAPTEESNDLASCAYCKLSLDGWEAKDEPFDEHHRRSSDCSFFVFSQPPTNKGKVSKAKKPRVSKASRVSTQSVATAVVDEPEMDVDDALDQSIMSQATTKSSKSTKKSTKGKGKGAKSKKEEPVEEIDVHSTELAQSEPSKPKRATRGKKRGSEEMNAQPVDIEEPEDTKPVEPPAKRRATRTRSSIAQSNNSETNDYAISDAEPVDEPVPEKEIKNSRKASKKGGASKSRKVSNVSTASRATSNARVPRDSEIDAAIEAGLEADDPESGEPEPDPAQTHTSKKTKSTKKSKAAPKTEQPAQDLEEDVVSREEPVAMEEIESLAKESQAKSKTAKGPKKKGTKKTKTKAQETRESIGSMSVADDHDRHESFVSVEIINRQPEPSREPESEPEPEPEPVSKAASKKGSKKKDAAAKKSKKSDKKTTRHEERVEPEDVLKSPAPVGDDDDFQTPDDMPDQVETVAPPQQLSPTPQRPHRTSPNVPAKTAKRYSDIPTEEHFTESLTSSHSPHNVHKQPKTEKVASLPPAARQSTPPMSPQSSDAENRPPSTRPSASRPPVVSPPKEWTPLAVTTPSPSKLNVSAKPVHPWTPVDVDEILFGEASDKENADLAGVLKDTKGGLTSPEKKMTVEEWIMWNAKNGEERLKRECERLVGVFEREGGRAMRRLDAIECID